MGNQDIESLSIGLCVERAAFKLWFQLKASCVDMRWQQLMSEPLKPATVGQWVAKICWDFPRPRSNVSGILQILQQVSEALWEALRKALLHKVVRASEGHAAEMYGKIDEHSILMYQAWRKESAWLLWFWTCLKFLLGIWVLCKLYALATSPPTDSGHFGIRP